jgi:hypothetical protein
MISLPLVVEFDWKPRGAVLGRQTTLLPVAASLLENMATRNS